MKIPKKTFECIIQQAQKEAPLEACGYLLGREGVVFHHREMTNVDKSNEHFTLDPKEQFKVVKEARVHNLDIIAVYHSHPETPARPSEEDIRLAFDSAILYVIVSIAHGSHDIKAFRISNGNVHAEEVEVVEHA